MEPKLQTSKTTSSSSSSSSSFKDPQKKQTLLTDPNLWGNYSNSLPWEILDTLSITAKDTRFSIAPQVQNPWQEAKKKLNPKL
jgi:hypothetical protein